MPESAGLHRNRVRATSFGEDAQQYDRARPTYPDALLDHLTALHPRTILDVGCGTGIFTRQLVARGCAVVGVEPDARMAAVARASGLDVEVATFEQWDARGREFDLVCSAQAWHWVDPVIGAAKTAELLGKGGSIALFWNLGKPSERDRAAFDACYQRLAIGIEANSVLLDRGNTERFVVSAAALERDGHFAAVEQVLFAHRLRYTTEQWLDLLATHSDHRTLAPDARSALFAELASVIDSFGGSFELGYETVCVSARRR